MSPKLGRTCALVRAVDFARAVDFFLAVVFFFAAGLRLVLDLRAGGRPRAVEVRFVERDRVERFDFVATVLATLVHLKNTNPAFRAQSVEARAIRATSWRWLATL